MSNPNEYAGLTKDGPMSDIYDQCSKVWHGARVDFDKVMEKLVDEDSDIDLDDPMIQSERNEAARLAVEAFVRANHPELPWSRCDVCKHDEPKVRLEFSTQVADVCAVCGFST